MEATRDTDTALSRYAGDPVPRVDSEPGQHSSDLLAQLLTQWQDVTQDKVTGALWEPRSPATPGNGAFCASTTAEIKGENATVSLRNQNSLKAGFISIDTENAY